MVSESAGAAAMRSTSSVLAWLASGHSSGVYGRSRPPRTLKPWRARFTAVPDDAAAFAIQQSEASPGPSYYGPVKDFADLASYAKVRAGMAREVRSRRRWTDTEE